MTSCEFVLPRRPVSQQARRQERLRDWKRFVSEHARLAVEQPGISVTEPVAVRLLYLYDEIAIDIDNILKPILDALVGVVFEDDAVVTDVEIRRRRLGVAFAVDAVSPVLAAGFALGQELVYVALTDAPLQDVLP